MSNVTIPTTTKACWVCTTPRNHWSDQNDFSGKALPCAAPEAGNRSIVVLHGSGLNDDLNGVERLSPSTSPAWMKKPRSYTVWPNGSAMRCISMVSVRQGLVTDMNAVRRDEEPDNLHSIYDQWTGSG